MKQIAQRVRIAAPVDDVWPVITHHEGMPDWSPLVRVTLKQEGSPDRDGVGAIRVMKAKGPAPAMEEQVTRWEPPTLYEYRLTRGAPIRDHRGRVELRDDGGATEVTWTIQFRPLVPGTGWLIQRALDKAIGAMLRRLQRRIES